MERHIKDLSHDEFMALTQTMRKMRGLEVEEKDYIKKVSGDYKILPDGSIDCDGPIKER